MGMTEAKQRPTSTRRQYQDMLARELAVEGQKLGKNGFDVKITSKEQERAIEIVDRIDREPWSAQPRTPQEVWRVCRENNTAGELPYILAKTMGKQVWHEAVNWNPVWPDICAVKSNPWLEQNVDHAIVGELDDLVEILSGETPPEGKITDAKIQLQTKVHGRRWVISPKAWINDDTGEIQRIQNRVPIVAERTIDKAVGAWILANGNASDSVAFFHATHSNTATTAMSADIVGADLLVTAALAMRAQTDISTNQILGIRPRTLVATPTLTYPKGRTLCLSDTIQAPTAAAPTLQIPNPFQPFGVRPVDFDYLGDTTDYYLFAEPGEAAAIAISFKKGKVLPTIIAGWDTSGFASTGGYVDSSGDPIFPVVIQCINYFNVQWFDWRYAYGFIVAGGT